MYLIVSAYFSSSGAQSNPARYSTIICSVHHSDMIFRVAKCKFVCLLKGEEAFMLNRYYLLSKQGLEFSMTWSLSFAGNI